MTTYDEAVAFLDARIGLGVQPGLERIEGLLDALADPHLAQPIIHVGGTNGKTSSVRYIAALLEGHAMSVGTFTSPHLEAIEERFGIGASHLTPAEFGQLVAEVAPIIELYEQRAETGITYFEATAALAFSLFASYPAAVGVVEVGLGGRLDATNVVMPQVAVITSIGLDHMGYLGETVAEIAAEKAAIVKDGVPLVTGALSADAEGVIAARAAETGSQRFRADVEFSVASAAPAGDGWLVDIEGIYGTYEEVGLHTHGRHQVDNFAISVAAAESLLGRELESAAVRNAAAISTPGRMEIVAAEPLVVIDGAHNVPAARALAATLDLEFSDTRWTVVFGAMTDKEYPEMLAALVPQARAVHAVAADSPRAAPPAEIAARAREHGLDASEHPSVAAGVEAAVAAAGANGAVLVTGSLYVAGEARIALATAR